MKRLTMCIKFLSCFGILSILMAGMLFFKVKFQKNNTQRVKSSDARDKEEKTDAVILFTKMRSGSSIVGSIFNKRENVTYLYEPLYPFGRGELSCKQDLEERLLALKYISTCQFEKLAQLYQETNRYDKNANCIKHNLCFVGAKTKFSEFISRDAGICRIKDDGSQACPVPIDPALLNNHCQKSLVRAMKVIYLCKLEWLMPFFGISKHNIKVIHLVRDPRSTIHSRLGGRQQSIEGLKVKAKFLCGNLVPNIEFGDMLNRSELSKKFKRIRFEDFVWDPIKKTREIFDFVGLNITDSVVSWLKNSTSSLHEDNLWIWVPQGLSRNPMSVLNHWRKNLPFEQVELIQKLCHPALKKLGYEIYDSEEELRNLKKLHFTPQP